MSGCRLQRDGDMAHRCWDSVWLTLTIKPCTLPETNKAPENRNRRFLLETIIFRGETVRFRESTVLICFCQLGSLNMFEQGARMIRWAPQICYMVSRFDGPNMIHLHVSYNPVTHDLLTSDILRDLKHIWGLCVIEIQSQTWWAIFAVRNPSSYVLNVLAMEKQSNHIIKKIGHIFLLIGTSLVWKYI